MEIYTDGAIYFQSQGRKFSAPSKSMGFELNDHNLELALSSFSLN